MTRPANVYLVVGDYDEAVHWFTEVLGRSGGDLRPVREYTRVAEPSPSARERRG